MKNSQLKTECSESITITQDSEGEYPQSSLQSCNCEGHREAVMARKSQIIFGFSRGTRTCSPSVNMPILKRGLSM